MPTASPYDEFWHWFRDNHDQLRESLTGNDSGALKALFDVGSKFAPDVALEVRGVEGRPIQLIATADGRRERVDAVKTFVAAAPAFPGWEVVAFRPRRELAGLNGLTFGGECVAPGDVWFRVERDRGASCLALYVRGLTEANRQMRGSGAARLAEDALGERDFVTFIATLHVEPLPDNPAGAGLCPLPELAAVIEPARQRLFAPPGELPLPAEKLWRVREQLIADKPAVILFNESLRPAAGHSSYDRRLSVHVFIRQQDKDGFPATKDEYDAVAGLGDRIAEALEVNQESLWALTITNQGQRVLIFYTSNVDAARKKLERWLTSEDTHPIWPQIRFDTYWSLYRKYSGREANGEGDKSKE